MVDLLAAQFVQERSVGEETIFILGISQSFQKLGAVFLGDFITHKSQESLELSQHHGSILIFVVQFAQLNVVVVVSGVFGLLDGSLDKFDNFVEFHEFLVNIVGLTELDASLLGQVHAHGVEDVHEVEHVDLAFAIPIVDGADLFDSFSIDRHVWIL